MLKQMLTNSELLVSAVVLCFLISYVIEQYPSIPWFAKIVLPLLSGVTLVTISWAIFLLIIRLYSKLYR